jgi:hypothetical protein
MSHDLPPTLGSSRLDLWVLAVLLGLVLAGGMGLAVGHGCAAHAEPSVEPAPSPTPGLDVS